MEELHEEKIRKKEERKNVFQKNGGIA